MLTDLQKKTSQAVVNVFETGSVSGRYGSVAVLPADNGHLSYGRSQAALGSGSLYALIKDYCAAPGAQYATELSTYLDRMRAIDVTLDSDDTLKQILRSAASDPVMRSIQDEFFDQNYWQPAMQACSRLSIATALGSCVIYDSFIQGSFGLIRDKVLAALGPIGPNHTEQEWISAYVQQRKRWLANNSNSSLPPTVYRMQAFETLMGSGAWALPLPITVCGVVIDGNNLSAGAPATRALKLSQPYIRGSDVEAVQQSLIRQGFPCATDGIFGPQTDGAVRAFQSSHGLNSDGIVGPNTRAALGLVHAAQAGT